MQWRACNYAVRERYIKAARLTYRDITHVHVIVSHKSIALAHSVLQAAKLVIRVHAQTAVRCKIKLY